jgi:hypothetical protein
MKQNLENNLKFACGSGYGGTQFVVCCERWTEVYGKLDRKLTPDVWHGS